MTTSPLFKSLKPIQWLQFVQQLLVYFLQLQLWRPICLMVQIILSKSASDYSKVTFKNQYNMDIVGNLVIPKNLNKRLKPLQL